MPAEEKERTLSLEDFAGFLDALETSGLEVVVIGGIAVGAYASLRGDTVLSADLDVYTTWETQVQIMDWAPAHGARVVKRPQPRSISVVFLEWEGKEINVLTHTSGLPPPAESMQEARVFHLRDPESLSVMVVDPYDLLRCKLEVNRPKDRPHQEVLRSFLEEEVVEAFRTGPGSRDRIAPAGRLLEVLKLKRLPDDLARRLLPHARSASDFRFLIGNAPDREFEDAVLAAVPESFGLREDLQRIADRRRRGRARPSTGTSPRPPRARPRAPSARKSRP
jgi:hypothetical protein